MGMFSLYKQVIDHQQINTPHLFYPQIHNLDIAATPFYYRHITYLSERRDIWHCYLDTTTPLRI